MRKAEVEVLAGGILVVPHAGPENADFEDGNDLLSQLGGDRGIDREALKFAPLFWPHLLHAAILCERYSNKAVCMRAAATYRF